MKIQKITEGDILILKVEGRVDAVTGEDFSEEVNEACHGGKVVRLDLSGVPYFSSAGLRGLLMGYKVARFAGGRMELYGVNDVLGSILKDTGLDKELIICTGDAYSPEETPCKTPGTKSGQEPSVTAEAHDPGLSDELKDKLKRLEEHLKELGSLAVGFSAGVDSSFLLEVAHKVLGDRVIAVTGVDASVPERELKEAEEFCKDRGIKHVLCTVDPMKNEEYRKNGPDRCYFCKHMIFTEIKRIAKENGIEYAAEGSNMDDLGDYRPGLKAVEELDVKSPLRQAGLYKADIRLISKAMGLPVWSKPAYACLASRFVYGEEITEEKLHMIDRAEQFLIELGFFEERVRMHGNIARIEVPPEDIPRLASEEIRTSVYDEFKKLGFLFVTLDMKGYRTGSMNATLNKK